MSAISRYGYRYDEPTYPISQPYELEFRQRELDKAAENRQAYLAASQAVPASAGMYALWLHAYTAQGGKITHVYNQDLSRSDFGRRTGSQDPCGHYARQWMPTVDPGVCIPAGYGANSLDLLILPDLVPVDLRPTSGDSRSGWEYGHTKVRALQLDRSMPTGVRAWTNQPDIVESFPDANVLLRKARKEKIDARCILEQLRRDSDHDFIIEESLPGVMPVRATMQVERDDDLFGLEGEPLDPKEAVARALFDDVLTRVESHAVKDKKILQQLRDPEAAVTLPTIRSNHLSARLHFRSLAEGTNVIHFEGLSRDGTGGSKGGFLLVQAADGRITLIDSLLEKALTSHDPEYDKYVQAAGKKLQAYFTTVGINRSGEVMAADSVFALRGALGTMSLRQARKTLKRGLQANP